jgi:23S rRNA (adenine2503-C2)-methyltransferase
MQTLIGKTTSELIQLSQELGQPAYRGKQLAEWLYKRGADSHESMKNLPAPFRTQLAEAYAVGKNQIAHRDSAPDGTIKYLMQLHDGEQVESVYLPYDERVSVCVSSQVGCPAGCTFCATAQGGLARNMTAGEIVDQILALQSDNPDRRISHCVFMGMGEPLFNYDEVIKSVRLLSEEVGMSPRHITISTVGVVPGILQLAEEQMPITLALSLHAPDDALRETLIPTARKWRLEEILSACRTYYQKTKRNLTFEYLLIGELNDAQEQAMALAELLGDLPGNVNLIPFNYVETAQGFKRPTPERIKAFRAELEAAGRVTTQRMVRGHAISAACGQLRRSAGTLRPRVGTIALNPLEPVVGR